MRRPGSRPGGPRRTDEVWTMRLRKGYAMKRLLAVSTASLLIAAGAARAQSGVGWTFTYQGQLNVSGQLANGSFDLEFKLFDSLAGGTQVGPTVAASNVAVFKGLI